MWQPAKNKQAPVACQQVLCAWQPNKKEGQWTYDVLFQWPDGEWTDLCENPLEQEDMPDYWEAISQPSWTQGIG